MSNRILPRVLLLVYRPYSLVPKLHSPALGVIRSWGSGVWERGYRPYAIDVTHYRCRTYHSFATHVTEINEVVTGK